MFLKKLNRIIFSNKTLVFLVVLLYGIANRIQKFDLSEENQSILKLKAVSIADKLQNYIDKNTKKLKIYIAQFDSTLNDKVLNETVNYGHGNIISYENKTSIGSFYTDQFSLDRIFYNRLINDQAVLTKNLTEANVVYVPLSLVELCSRITHKLSLWLGENEKAFSGKIVFLLYGGIEWALYKDCGLKGETRQLFEKYVSNLLMGLLDHWWLPPSKYNTLITPYPTITKFALKQDQLKYEYDLNEDRPIDIFFAGNKRRRGKIHRRFIFSRIKTRTELSFKEFSLINDNTPKNSYKSVIYDFGFSNYGSWDHRASNLKKQKTTIDTIEWKKHTQLCVEPPGDTQTRRSFWDAIFLGCIPVIFEPFDYPFRDQIDYSRFVITVDISWEQLESNKTDFNAIFKPYLENKKWLRDARQYIKEIRQYLQFTWIFNDQNKSINSTFKYDAYGMLLAEIAKFVPFKENRYKENRRVKVYHY